MDKLQGVVPPMVTPFDESGRVDIPALERLVGYLAERVNGLYICGSYGSGPLMDVDERKKVAETTMEAVAGRIPVIVHAGCINTRDTVELTRHAERIGCAGAAAVGPWYFHHGKGDVQAFYEAMLKAVTPGFPVYLYHNPKFSGYEIGLDVLRSLKEKGLCGIKDATFDILKFAAYMRELGGDGFDVVLGTESMWLSACALGAEAYIPGLGNAFPEICAKMWKEGMDGDFAACRKTQFEVNRLRDVMYLARSTQLAVYTMLEIRGVVRAYPRQPFLPASEEEKKKIRAALDKMGVL